MTIFEGLVVSLLALVPPAVAALITLDRRIRELALSLAGTRERLRRLEQMRPPAEAGPPPLHAIPPGPPDSDARPHTTVGLGPRGPA